MDNKKSPPSNNQKWFLQYLIANKTTAIISMTTGSDSTQFALDGGAQGNPLVLSAFNGNPKPSQQWIDHDNYWQFASDPTLVMDVAGANTTAGTSVILWPRNSPPSNNQQFTKEDTVRFIICLWWKEEGVDLLIILKQSVPIWVKRRQL